jgi:hypothetical protein
MVIVFFIFKTGIKSRFSCDKLSVENLNKPLQKSSNPLK